MTEYLWYKNAVVYSLDLETFMDGNGDGTGDFKGLCDRLDYLHALGVDMLWLAPFSPRRTRITDMISPITTVLIQDMAAGEIL